MKPSIKADGVTAAIFAPIKIGGLVLGVIYIDTLSEAGFIDYDGYLLTTLAYHVANILRSSRHKRRSDLLSGLVYHLDLTQPIQTLLNTICRQAGALFQVDEASIQIYGAAETGAQQPERYPTLTLGLWQRDGQSTISLSAISQQFLETFKRNDTIRIENDTPAAAYAPIRIEGESYGVLSVRTVNNADIFLQDDIQYLDALAHIISLLIRSVEFNEQLKQIIDIAPIGVMAIGNQGRVTLVSEVTRRLLDYSEGLPAAFNVQDVYAGGRAAARNIKSYIEEAPDGILRNYRATLRAADGSLIPTNITATQFKRLNGEQVGGFGFFYDHREQEVLNGIASLVINDHQPADLFAR
ncbi:MAG: hypothetical protein KDE09_15250, partial [Anaerolineales bacterium]|nr:hypothetical protein [Anaerolineales bacterium]